MITEKDFYYKRGDKLRLMLEKEKKIFTPKKKKIADDEDFSLS